MFDGNLAELRKSKGVIEVYGFNFPLVVEIPIGSKMISLGTHLKLLTYPLSPGVHCVKGIGESIPTYENTSVIVNNSISFLRIVREDLQDINAIVRDRYFRNYRLPCVGINRQLRGALNTVTVTFTVNSKAAITMTRLVQFPLLTHAINFSGACLNLAIQVIRILYLRISSAALMLMVLFHTFITLMR